MGRTTSWPTDVQGRRTGKQYGDGSQVQYLYENASSRLRQVIDEKRQVTQPTYNPDNTLHSTAYANTTVPTPSVSYTYDPNYQRLASMTDGAGTTIYRYAPITASPVLGAGRMASVDGPLPNDTITYEYDELGRRTQTAINGVASTRTFDAAGRILGESNALGSFTYAYAGSSARVVSQAFPNGQTAAASYGGHLQDFMLQQISYAASATPISQFLYGHDIPAQRITNWSQQAGTQPPSVFSLGYDAANQLLSATVTNAETLVNTFAYAYDPAGNRLTEQVGASNYSATYNALNQISTRTRPGASRTNEWDALDRLTAVNVGNQRTEFTYDGQSRRVGIRQLLNSSEVSRRRFVWRGSQICEERDATGAVVTKRFFPRGVRVETGPTTGSYYYTRDHLGSIRELTDASGDVRARYSYDPDGRRTKVSGDVDADFGFADMFWSFEASLALTHFRAYDPELGRWLSRDPLKNAEVREGPNLYAYVGNNPINLIDPLGTGVVFTPPYEPAPPSGPATPAAPAPVAPPAIPPVAEPPIVYTPSTPGPPIYGETYILPPGGGVVAETGFLGTGCSLLEVAGPVLFVFHFGYVVGTGIDQTFHISGWASDEGAQANQLALDEGYSETTADVLGAFITLGSLSPASGGLFDAIFR